MRYCRLHVARIKNTGSYIAYESHEGNFYHAFVSFDAAVTELQHYRTVIFIDACNLKGKFRDESFGAFTTDGDNGFDTVSFAVMDQENGTNKTWFMSNINEAKYTFRSTLLWFPIVKMG